MKTILSFAAAILILAALPAASLKAGPSLKAGQWEDETTLGLLPPSAIIHTVRYMGFSPNTPALRRGSVYVLHAFDPRGVEMRIVADAQLGDILSIEPALVLNQIYPPQYFSGPLIIHVPQHEQAPPARSNPPRRG